MAGEVGERPSLVSPNESNSGRWEIALCLASDGGSLESRKAIIHAVPVARETPFEHRRSKKTFAHWPGGNTQRPTERRLLDIFYDAMQIGSLVTYSYLHRAHCLLQAPILGLDDGYWSSLTAIFD